MNFPLKSKKYLKVIAVLTTSLVLGIGVVLGGFGTVWFTWDYQILDIFYRYAIQHRHGVPASPLILYVVITDEAYDAFGKNFLDRADMARVNDVLANFGAAAVAYDIIFARPSTPSADQRFTESLNRLGVVYLPIGFDYHAHARPFRWEEGVAYERLRGQYLQKPLEFSKGTPLHATRALMQADDFSEVAFGSGHISIANDVDGVFRYIPLVIKVDDGYFPTLALSMFLDYIKVPLKDITLHWNKHIRIPALSGSKLDHDIVIPIDKQGRTFIPYVQTWKQDFEKIAAHALLKHYEDPDLHGNLQETFEGKFVFVGDISVGISDIGDTPLEQGVPLVALHAALLNGLLQHTFYRTWSFRQVLGLIGLFGLLLGLSALPRSSWWLYGTGGLLLLGTLALAWMQMLHFALLPIVTVSSSVLFIFFNLVIGLSIVVSKDQAFIRNAFSKYVPESVVSALLAHPELLQLGGEERVLSVLFSDIESFTSIAENMPPPELVRFLNEFLTEMTAVILAQGGIIDKYEGDAIMAEFGAPLQLANHAEHAVRAGLHMQRRLKELHEPWAKRGLPLLKCRVGINTGSMLVGNMGSNQVFDYTVIGDSVNLASRLESANKFYHTYMMIAASTHERLPADTFRTRILDVIKVQGKAHAVKVFEVYGETHDPIDPDVLLYYQTYHEAFTAYLARRFAEARAQFVAALSLRPDDPAAHNMILRIDALDPLALPDDWDGSVTLTSK